MDDALTWAMQLSYDLDGITDRLSVLSLIGRAIDRALPGDTGGLVQADIANGRVTISGNPHGSVEPETTTTLARVVMSHPKAISYMSTPKDLRPRRMTDIIGNLAWRSHPVYRELFVPLGAFYQLTILVTPFHRAGGGDVWAVNRSLRDFTDDEVELSARLQPALTVLHRASEHRPTLARSDNTDRLRMTTREVEILGLLAQGFTADQMAHITRISPRTVRKHLENIYEKMQCHDRLIAVRRAADLGLISPDASNGSQRRSPSERSTAV